MRRGESLERKDRRDAERPDDQGGAVRVADRLRDLDGGVDERVGAWNRDAQHVLHLRRHDDDRRRGGEADEHGVRQEVDDEAQASEAQ